jgi:transcriptional regulator with XRE-family HTH domain
MADNALGTFLRQRREAVTPAQVGLPPGGRRRTPGLRRAEVATLAGVSVDYLTRLEQGRDRHPSAQVLAALADTLQLSDDERVLLMRLGTIANSGEMCPGVQPPDREVRPAVRLLLASMEPTVAAVVDRSGDVLVRTAAWDRFFEGLGVLDHHPPNLVRYLFTDPRARVAYPAWEVVADAVAAEVLTDNRPDDPVFQEFLDSLGPAGSEQLGARLAAGPAVARRTRVERIVHPEVGELRLAYESMSVEETDQRLVVHLPHDEATGRALDAVVLGGAGGLRAGTG